MMGLIILLIILVIINKMVIFCRNIKLTDDGTKLLYPMEYGNPIGKEMIYQLAEPIVKQSEVVGNLISYPNGIIYTHKKVYDVSIYNDEITILNTNLPIQTITKLVKIDFETGLETELNKSLAIIDENGLSFTHPNLINNDIVYFEYEYNQKLTSYPVLDITYLDNRYVLEDEDNPNTFYKVVRKVKSGVLIEELELIE